MKDFSNAFQNSFIDNITPESEKKKLIHDAVQEIKAELSGKLYELHDRKPRFMTQGSAGYKTQNNPCYDTQQIDHDIGCYYPFSEWEDQKPKTAAKDFFSEVDSILEKLAEKKGWKTRKDKNTCARVIISDDIHIDIPLYSIPDDEFKTITESVEARKSYNFAADSKATEEESWDDFEFDKVLLAKRDGDWQESDPRKINIYFKNAFALKGEQFRRLCRYIKAWRDYKWEQCGPTSIYLMCLVDDLYDSNQGKDDDEALLQILQSIPNRLASPVVNKSEDEKLELKNPEDLQKLKDYAIDFSTDLGKAINDSTLSSRQACLLIQKNLGDRFPVLDNMPTKNKSIATEIKQTPISSSSSSPLGRTRVG